MRRPRWSACLCQECGGRGIGWTARPFGLDKDKVHDIKKGVGAGPKDWVGIDPDGNVWTGDENNQGVNHGPFGDYLS